LQAGIQFVRLAALFRKSAHQSPCPALPVLDIARAARLRSEKFHAWLRSRWVRGAAPLTTIARGKFRCTPPPPEPERRERPRGLRACSCALVGMQGVS